MPTFLTEYTCQEHGETALGPYITTPTRAEAEAIAACLSIHDDGVRIAVIGEAGEMIPAGINPNALRMLQHRVAFEVEQIIAAPRPEPRLAFLLGEPKDE